MPSLAVIHHHSGGTFGGVSIVSVLTLLGSFIKDLTLKGKFAKDVTLKGKDAGITLKGKV